MNDKRVCLVRGFLGSVLGGWPPVGSSYFRGVKALYEKMGYAVLEPILEQTGIEEQAGALYRFLSKHTVPNDGDLHLVAHSAGGLISRALLRDSGTVDMFHVKSLTTIGTPHRGSPVADGALDEGWGLEWLTGFLGWKDLTTDSCRAFNQRTPDPVGVRCYSVAGIWDSQPADPWRLTQKYFGDESNDGLVAVASAVCGPLDVWTASHERLLNWGGADHLEQYAELLRRASSS
jgi:triacylglycerol lipase